MPRAPKNRMRRLAMAAQNALEIARFGRLSREAYGAPYDVVHGDQHYKLRHYRGLADERASGIPLLLVPPLMLTAEIYDMAADVSAVRSLIGQNIDVWLVDFGAPEHQSGGMERTLDDHVRAIDDAVERVREHAGRDVHLAGYSQGGMFTYQVAAFRQSRGLASLITFGSPVDIHRNLPNVDDQITDRLIAGLRSMIAAPLARIEGLPGVVTSTGFKLLSLRKEVQQVTDFVRKLHDRRALVKRESRRLFLGGEGFVAWPGPAFRKFVDDIIVHNRMLSGGIVIDGRTISLADIDTPILYFVGLRDEIARPAAVRSIDRAAPHARPYEVAIKAGHFGIVVGSTALDITWPTVAQWLKWQEGNGPRPEQLGFDRSNTDQDDPEQLGELPLDIELFYDVVADAGRALWNRLGDALDALGSSVHDVRVQYPYLERLRAIDAQTRISAGLVLAEQAEAIPDKTFFLWRDRAFSYGDANRRIDHVVRGLVSCGVTPGQRVAVLMKSRPSYLTIVTALNRLGAVAVLLRPDRSLQTLMRAMELADVSHVVADPEHALRGREAFDGPVLVLGGGRRARAELATALAQRGSVDMEVQTGDIIDMETIDPATVQMPAWYRPNPGQARDLAFIIIGGGRSGAPRPSYITNWRWAFSALGAAAACTLNPRDTVYCCLSLHHAAGTLVAAGSGLVGGARVALATPFEPRTFWQQVRRYGATVVFYAGEMCRALVDAPADPADGNHPVRLFAGSGMRKGLWGEMRDRFGGVDVLEFYASTEGNAVLANASGDKMGAIGQPIPASAQLALVAYDFHHRQYARDVQGRMRRCRVDEPGVLLARLDENHPNHRLTDRAWVSRVVRGVLTADDTWYLTGAVARRDRDGDYWFLERLRDVLLVGEVPVFTRVVEDELYSMEPVALAVAYGLELPGVSEPVLVAALVTHDREPLTPEALDQLAARRLDSHTRPRFIRQVESIAMTDGFRPLKSVLRGQGLSTAEPNALFWDPAHGSYRPLDQAGFARVLAELKGS